MLQKRIFIGSSAEQIKTLNYVTKLLEPDAKCIPWTSAFDLNKSGLDSLIKHTRLADYAILIATKDDLTKSRGTKKATPRDNVIFEFGLFLGSASPERCFLLVEEGAALPSDLNGITLSKFTWDTTKHNYIDKVVAEITEKIETTNNVSELGLLPSTALAIGYYNGFIKKVCEKVHKTKSILIDGKKVKVKNFKINVVIPENIDDNGVGDFITLYNQHHKLTKATTFVDGTLELDDRGYPFHFKVDPPEPDLGKEVEIHISDIPNTLSTIVEALKLYLPPKSVGRDYDIEHLERRELENFANVLIFLIEKNTITKKVVTVERNVTL
nr:STING domain-containing protein [Pedobacter panaciterrae]